jgi:hypothetical protein
MRRERRARTAEFKRGAADRLADAILSEVLRGLLPRLDPARRERLRRRLADVIHADVVGWPAFPCGVHVRRLREHHGETRAQFGERFLVSARAVARWEADPRPLRGPAGVVFTREWLAAGWRLP